jgi:dihydrofolate reductase
MGKIVVTQFMSLDGVIEDPGGAEDYEHGGWVFKFDRGTDGDSFKLDETMAADALLLGRTTYEGFAAAWPEREGDFADKFNSMPKHVVSTTLSDPEWSNSEVISEDVPAAVAALRDRYEGDILINGSATLVRELNEHGLIDEYRVMLFPVVLGHGLRLWTDGNASTKLRLVSAREIGPDGVMILIYEPT